MVTISLIPKERTIISSHKNKTSKQTKTNQTQHKNMKFESSTTAFTALAFLFSSSLFESVSGQNMLRGGGAVRSSIVESVDHVTHNRNLGALAVATCEGSTCQPHPDLEAAIDDVAGSSGGAGSSFSVTAQGQGQLTGLSYTVPAFTEGQVTATLEMNVMSSVQVANLEAGWAALLNDTQKQLYTHYKTTHESASAHVNWFDFFSGGASASYSSTETTTNMHSLGLTDDQIDQMMEMLAEEAQKMNYAELNLTVDNENDPFSVSGNLLLYTIIGKVTTKKGTYDYRMISDAGTAGVYPNQAPASGSIIPLN
jgi:hypothetical protein